MAPKLELAYEATGGGIRRSNALYVERQNDIDLLDRLTQTRDVVVISAPRQSGKTSLLHHLKKHLEEANTNIGIIEFSAFMGSGEERLREGNEWFETLMRQVAFAFDLDSKPTNSWLQENSKLGLLEKFVAFFRDFLRVQLTGHIVIVFDEIDQVLKYNYFTDSFFESIRSLGQDRFELDMSFVLAGVNHPSDLHTDAQTFSFNVGGEPLSLTDFDTTEPNAIDLWAKPYLIEDRNVAREISERVLSETAGHPFLTARILDEAHKEGVTDRAQVELLLADRKMKAKERQWLWFHFRYPGDVLTKWADYFQLVVSDYEKILTSNVPVSEIDAKSLTILQAAGLVAVEGKERRFVKIRSPFYRDVFDAEWLEDLSNQLGTNVSHQQSRPVNPVPNLTPRKKICIINTGGMISTEVQNDGTVGIPQDLSRFFARFPDLTALADFVAVPLMSKDSSDINPDDWEKLAGAIFSRINDGFDGFVVAHGTDTLPHTASAVAFALGRDLNFPVVFVGSQLGTHEIHGDARINLMRAATVATREIPEVLCVVGDEIHRGVRVQKRSDYRLNCFHSPTWQELGVISDDIDIRPSDMRKVDPTREMVLQNKFSRNIFKIGLYPGLDPRYLMPVLDDENIDGIIIETLGIGNVPVEGNWSLIPFIVRAKELNIPVLLVSQFPIQSRMTANYEPARPPLRAGAIAALNMSPPAAVTKFMWALPQVLRKIEAGFPAGRKIEEIERMMSMNYVGEIEESSKNSADQHLVVTSKTPA